MALVGEGGQRHYAAKVEMQPRLLRGAPLPEVGGLSPWQDIVYGDVLFHGPMFHAIQGLDGESERGIAGTLIGTAVGIVLAVLFWLRDRRRP